VTLIGPDPGIHDEKQGFAMERACLLRSMFPATRTVARDEPATMELPHLAGAAGPGARRRRIALVVGTAVAALLVGGLATYPWGDSGPGTDTASRPVAPATVPLDNVVPVPSIAPSPSPSAPPSTRPGAPATATTRASHATASPSLNLAGPLDGTGELLGLNGQCLDNQSSLTNDGNPIQTWGCDTTSAQVWTVADGRYSVQGKCLTPAADGTAVVLWTCAGNPAQRWRADPTDHSVRNLATGRCLTARDSYTPVIVAACTGVPGQRWTRR
jgi:hypothetical protein